ncbi:unnamed protein product [Blepharisma stoltei]|uniref:Uncharacterized protein n=1 Tax=Blepharisma stoltei TaxID=1481888 RepID=A0AAU9JWM0_9CILI|nr:unnamed protein product [Blepharisma stoltei]
MKRRFTLRKRPQSMEFFTNDTSPLKSSSRFKLVTILRKLNRKNTPPPGSLEEDFMLENQNDNANFLQPNVPMDIKIGPKFDERGEPIRHSFVGPPQLFASSQRHKWKKHLSIKDTYNSPEQIKKIRTKVKIDPEDKIRNQIKMINEGKRKEEEIEKKMLKSMSVGERLLSERETKIMKTYDSTISSWNKIENGLIKKTNKNYESLLTNRAMEFREKREKYSLVENLVNAGENSNNYAWVMSLRQSSLDKYPSTFLKVGVDLYTWVCMRTNSSEPIIRNPQGRRSSSKTFRDYPYCQSKVEEAHKILGDKSPTEIDQLQVIGTSKFPIELEAAKTAGFSNVIINDPDTHLPDEVIEEFYDKKFKLRKY